MKKLPSVEVMENLMNLRNDYYIGRLDLKNFDKQSPEFTDKINELIKINAKIKEIQQNYIL